MRKDDVIGISTMTFTPTGEAFYLSSSSELARVSMAAAYNLQPSGTLTPIDRHVISDGKAKAKKPEPAAAVPTAIKKASTDDAEAAAVARQNQLNEQQAQGFHTLNLNNIPESIRKLALNGP